MQLCIENVDQAGGCSYGYSCVYTDSISWASPTEPLPMVRDPRAVFDQLFGVGASVKDRAERRSEDRSILDWIASDMSKMKAALGTADRARLSDYLDDLREIERRIQRVEQYNSSGAQRDLPEAPIGVPDSFEEHVKLMFDLQVLAFQSDTTRVFAFKLGRDASNRVYPDSGVTTAFHSASHHQAREDRIMQFAKINRYHISMLPYFFKKLQDTPDGESNLLENTLVIYGSPMGDSNVHNHKRVPFLLGGHAGGQAQGRTAHQDARRDAARQRHAERGAYARFGPAEVRRQHGGNRPERRAEHHAVSNLSGFRYSFRYQEGQGWRPGLFFSPSI